MIVKTQSTLPLFYPHINMRIKDYVVIKYP